ncbi:MAG: hypothetical protein KGZ90_02930 [Algoriphagus sp.]|nr:hypothetical protein [Algoriphagus sp.]
MLVRITGGSEGIAEYLANGQKADREFTRDELDERVILDGDLELTDTIIKGMEKEGERYLHITLAFKEDALDPEVMRGLVSDFKQFAMSAYDADEFNFYAEAHLPKLKSYTNRQTGELVERKPHIHIVIPEQNLLSGQNLNPFGRVEQQTKFLEAFQEHANAKYGLASPKDNRRTEFTSESEIISRYKGDLFQGSAKELKERILSDVLDRKISDYDGFKALLTEYGAARSRNAGKATEYQNVKPADQAKGINLKDYVFSREFIEKPEAEKRRHLADEGRRQYESQQPARKTAPELAATLKEWHEVRAKELKYINSGNRKLYAAYRSADREGKRAMLDERAATFYTKHRKETDHDRTDEQRRDFRGRENAADRGTDSRRTVAHIADNLRAAGRNIESTGRAVGDAEQARRNLADRRASRAVAALGRRLGRDQSEDRQVSRAAPQPRDRRAADSVTGQLLAEARERKTEGKAAHLAEFAQIKRELDARRLLAHLSKTHGVIPEKYEVTQGKDGGDRIKAGSRNLNVSDFLTQEMRLSFSEAAPILRQVYAAQQGRELAEARPSPRRELWQAFRQAQPEQAKQKAAEWEAQRQSERERRAAIRDDYQGERRALQADRSKPAAERKAALSIARMERVTKDMALREAIREERQQLKEKHGQPYQERYRAFLAERANKGDETALAELRRQRDASPAPTAEANTIEGSSKRKRDSDQAAQLARNLAYSVDRAGNVTYYADQAKRRALVIDSGQRVTVAAVKDSQAVEAGLRLAVQKFGPGLKIEGSEEFKRQVIDAALKTGLRVEFDSKAMNDELQRRRAERDELQARGKAFIASEREKAEQAKAPKEPATPAPEKTREPERAPQPEPARKPRGYER